jgi:predicted glycoside hydrolase/deacetylase ChbG (UPF0249 family)
MVDEAGYFWHQSIFEEKVNLEEVYNEWDAQIISFMKSGRRPDHINNQLHLLRKEPFLEVK